MFSYPSQVIIGDISPYTQAIAILNQTVFGTNWTANASSDVFVYLTPFGDEPDDTIQLLDPSQYNVAFIGSQEEVQITLITPAAAGDRITITRQTPASRENLYTNTNFTPTMLNNDFAILTLVDQQAQLVNQLVGPRYNYSALIQDVIDTILPILPPNYVWVKDSTNTAIIAVPLPGGGVPGGGSVNSGLQNQIAWYATNGTTVSGLPTGNNGVLVTSPSGAPSISSTLPSGLTIPNIKGAVSISDLQTIYDINGNVVLSLGTPSPLSVNYLGVTNNGTGFPPVLQAAGSDTNISLLLSGKGTGGIYLKGFTNGIAIDSGYVGETLSVTVPFASGVALVNNTSVNIMTLPLTAGNWLVLANLFMDFTVEGNSCSAVISTTTGPVPPGTPSDFSLLNVLTLATGSISNYGLSAPSVILNLSAPATIYLLGGCMFASGTGKACGKMTAIRIS